MLQPTTQLIQPRKEKKVLCTRASDKKRSDQFDKPMKTSETSKKPRLGNEQQLTGKISYPVRPSYVSLSSAYHSLNMPVLEIMHTMRNDPLMMRPPPMYTQPQDRNLRRFCHHHNEHVYYTDDYRHLKALINDNINNDHWAETEAGEDSGTKKDRDADSQNPQPRRRYPNFTNLNMISLLPWDSMLESEEKLHGQDEKQKTRSRSQLGSALCPTCQRGKLNSVAHLVVCQTKSEPDGRPMGFQSGSSTSP
ncbi:hypothetical protein NE237_021818 [Protea cynaroides]|uniref:Uncharacterized protein n=1 Tax=Protea cynaroides TaxID=273540 RepID=A0A9Q0K582_9MAGN|nr:hypothetical protein NE237_021818 [Protea cynaroides]